MSWNKFTFKFDSFFNILHWRCGACNAIKLTFFQRILKIEETENLFMKSFTLKNIKFFFVKMIYTKLLSSAFMSVGCSLLLCFSNNTKKKEFHFENLCRFTSNTREFAKSKNYFIFFYTVNVKHTNIFEDFKLIRNESTDDSILYPLSYIYIHANIG
jgi:hypothetical protein